MIVYSRSSTFAKSRLVTVCRDISTFNSRVVSVAGHYNLAVFYEHKVCLGVIVEGAKKSDQEI